MTEEEKNYVSDCIDNEGFDYCFVNYSKFPKIKDKEFHRLRTEYLDAMVNLAEYVGHEL